MFIIKQYFAHFICCLVASVSAQFIRPSSIFRHVRFEDLYMIIRVYFSIYTFKLQICYSSLSNRCFCEMFVVRYISRCYCFHSSKGYLGCGGRFLLKGFTNGDCCLDVLFEKM